MRWVEQVAIYWWQWMFYASLQLAILIAFVAVLTHLLRLRSALLLHWLWFIVLAKAFLPPFIRLPADSFPWLASAVPREIAWNSNIDAPPMVSAAQGANELAQVLPSGAVSPLVVLFAVWLVGLILFWLIVIKGYWRLTRSLENIGPVDEGPLRIEYERVALGLGIENCPELRVTDLWTSPFLVGVKNPSVVMPVSVIQNASEQDIAVVMTHELVHYQRRDIWIGWLQVIALSTFWFNPFFWWAMQQLRQSREEACDESVLKQTSIATEDYGDAMLRLVTRAQARSLGGIGLVGVFERSTQIQTRLEKIMAFKKSTTRFGLGSKVLLALLCLVLIPMPLMQVINADESSASKNESDSKSAVPQIVSTDPEVGATDIKPSITEIRITFDRDMRAGMSWTGGPPYFPPAGDGEAHWVDKRTCVLPVKLERGKFYRAGINSKSFLNFKSANGTSAYPSAIYFATEGASSDVIALAKTPEIVRIEPANGAKDVDPNLETLSVTFNMPMGAGMSWTGSGPQFPVAPEGKRPTWSQDKRTCTMPVKLQAGKKYQVGLNSKNHKNFQSVGGVPLQPIVYSFQTK